MAQQYLKCKYYENAPMIVFSTEYLITFKIKNMAKINPSVLIGKNEDIEFPARDEEWCIVSRGDVVPLKDNNGLVGLIDLTMNEVRDEAHVAIKNIDGITYFTVPIDDVIVE